MIEGPKAGHEKEDSHGDVGCQEKIRAANKKKKEARLCVLGKPVRYCLNGKSLQFDVART